MNKKILITGAAGFLGSHLCDKFLSLGYKVIGIDNLITGSESNVKHLASNSNFELRDIDITKKFKFKDKVEDIMHFASPASPMDYLKMPIETMRVGSIGTENILKIAEKNNSKILVASTSEIYGDPIEHPQKETYFGNVNCIGPRGVYDEAKRYLEAITYAYKRFKGINVRVARIFNTYGPRMRINDGRAIPTFINQSLNNLPFTVFGNGTQTRSFCYIDDTIDGLCKLLFSKYSLPVNIGNDEEYKLIDLVMLIKKISNSKSEIIYEDLPENDPLRRKPEISIAKKILKWSPKIDLETGLKKTIHFYLYNNS